MTKVVWTQEEDSKSLMDRDRRKEAIKVKLHRLDSCILRTKKDQEGQFRRNIWQKFKLFHWWKDFTCCPILRTRGCALFLFQSSTVLFEVLQSWWNPTLETHRSPPRKTWRKQSSSWMRWVLLVPGATPITWWVDAVDGVFFRPSVFAEAGSPGGHAFQALGGAGRTERDDDQVLSPFQGQHREMEGQGEDTFALEVVCFFCFFLMIERHFDKRTEEIISSKK